MAHITITLGTTYVIDSDVYLRAMDIINKALSRTHYGLHAITGQANYATFVDMLKAKGVHDSFFTTASMGDFPNGCAGLVLMIHNGVPATTEIQAIMLMVALGILSDSIAGDLPVRIILGWTWDQAFDCLFKIMEAYRLSLSGQ
jgi:hypothetical protein